MKKDNLKIKPHPDKVLIKCSLEAFKELMYKWIVKKDKTRTKLWTAIEYDEGFDNRFQQNISTASVIAVGKNVKNIFPSDLIILDYLVYNSDDGLVGFVNGDRIVALDPKTTYHTTDALPSTTMRKAFVKGDVDYLSKILGVIRNDKLISFSPYVFITKKSAKIVKVGIGGLMFEETETIVEREVLAAPEGSRFSEGNTVVVKEADLCFRTIGNKEISFCFENEILMRK